MTASETFVTATGRQVARFIADESGATAIEYAMIASGIGAAVVTMVYTLGDKVKALFTSVSALL
jgi:pilus assembly protein Flp/PilA